MTPRLLAVALLAALAAACTAPDPIPRNVVVLLDAPAGGPNAVEIRNAAGRRVLDQPGQALGVDDPQVATRPPIAVPADRFQQIFGAAVRAQPQAPEKFILYFETGGTDLTPESASELATIRARVQARTAPDVAIVGHADKTGDPVRNVALSTRRAEKIKAEIVALGVDAAQIEVSSHGDSNPLVPQTQGVAEPRNRRVEVFVR